MIQTRCRRVVMLLILALLTGCAAQRAKDAGESAIALGRYEEGLAKMDEAARLAPSDRAYRQQWLRERELAVQRLVMAGDEARMKAEPDRARQQYERAHSIDPAHARPKAGMEGLAREAQVRAELASAEQMIAAGDLDEAYPKIREALAQPGTATQARAVLKKLELAATAAAPTQRLREAFRKPINMAFRDAPIRMAFDLLASNTGLNFILDKDVRQDIRVTISVTQTSIEEVLRFMLVSYQLEKKVLNDRSVLIYPNTAAKNRDYQELVVKTFYLANADVKQTVNLLRTVARIRDIFIDEKINMVVIRDTGDAVRMAEKLIVNQDLAEPEVMLEVEVLEVSSSALLDLGIRYPDQVSFSVAGAAGAGQLTLPEWLNRSADLVRIGVSSPALILNLRNQVGAANLLANPKIRVRNREKAKVHIGDKVPVITTTTTATGFVSESVNYLDVGLKLDVEANVHIEEEVGMKVTLEVSSILEQVRSQSGTLAYRVGTRNASTSLRLRDNETQVLAGLISDEDRSGSNRIPGLGSLPVVGRLFGSHLDQSSKTEIVLLITPRVIRPLLRPDARTTEFFSGTEGAMGGGGGSAPSFASPANISPTNVPMNIPGAPPQPPGVPARIGPGTPSFPGSPTGPR